LTESFIILFYFLIVLLGTRFYINFAVKRNITAKINFRTLHKSEMPKGGGIIIYASVVLGLSFISHFQEIDNKLFDGIVIGGSIIAIYGFIDDILDIQRYKKFITLSLISFIPLLIFGESNIINIDLPQPLLLLMYWFSILWFLNAYNFIDGIDGLATSIGAFISFAVLVLNFMTFMYFDINVISLLIMISCLAFLAFNFPPARVFMGDTGSLFLGYSIVIMILHTSHHDLISIWTWLILLSFVLGETTTTTILRIFLTEKWYGAHRSHAYQNLARITDSHKTVLLGITFYHLLWILPLALLSQIYENYEKLFFVQAVLPVILMNLIYGPKFSSK